MSGIILPGKENKPQEGGKIEVAKGFTRSRERKAEEAPAAAPPPASAPGSAPPAPPTAQGPRRTSNLMFPPVGAQVQCPSCGTPYVVPIFSIIDLGVNPELKGPLLGGQVNVAMCPNCGMGGPLSAPLLVHDPGHEFLGVFIPPEARMDDLQRQKAIGDLTQTLMRKLPTEARRGYMLQAKQYSDWQRFQEVLWGFEGVPPEVLRRQRDQAAALQRLVTLANDPKALEIALERDRPLIDKQFFALLDRFLVLSNGQGQAAVEPLLRLRQELLVRTEAGQQIAAREERIRAILTSISAATTREDLVAIVTDTWMGEDGQEVVGAIAVAAAPLLDYQFLVVLTERIDKTADPAQREKLEALRQFIVSIQEQQRQSQAAMAQQVQALLQEVLQSSDTEATLRKYADLIDETFLSILASNIQAAEKNKATAALRRLTQVYDQALAILQENLPEDLRLLNQLLAAPDPAAMRKLLKDNRSLLTKEFLEQVTGLEVEMREAGRTEMADRLKSLRGQVALML